MHRRNGCVGGPSHAGIGRSGRAGKRARFFAKCSLGWLTRRLGKRRVGQLCGFFWGVDGGFARERRAVGGGDPNFRSEMGLRGSDVDE